MKAQMSLLDEITVDGFCGGGGWSTGFELAIGRPVDIGINHDAAAIALHKANHPFTRHYQTNIFDVDPVKACQGRKVGWAHFSPDCKHFSRAKGAKPVSKKIRSLAWVVLKWASAVKPRIISMENVPEFLTWGPLVAMRGEHGRVMRSDGTEAAPGEHTPFQNQTMTPDRKRAGETFRNFVKCLASMGYDVEWRTLKACDYGAPTSRTRFFLLARCDGKKIVWPKQTHGDPESMEVINGKLLPWVPVSSVLDFSNTGESIFERKKPLADNTMRRIARGLEKYVIDNPEPYIVDGKAPFAIQYHTERGMEVRGQKLDLPLNTIATHDGYGMVSATLIQYHTEQGTGEHRGQDVEHPLQTVDASNRYGLVSAMLVQFNNNCSGRNCSEPIPTITMQGNHFGLVSAFLTKYYGCSGKPEESSQSVQVPLGTITTKDRFGLVTVYGTQYRISDICLRMLTPRELYDAQGFPHDYRIDTDCYGNAYPKKEQVARCGNAVPPAFASALARANAPEWCTEKPAETMREWEERVAM